MILVVKDVHTMITPVRHSPVMATTPIQAPIVPNSFLRPDLSSIVTIGMVV